jgi:hypothetical protein
VAPLPGVAWPLSYGLNGEEQATQEISRWLERYVAREVYRVLISRLLLPCAVRLATHSCVRRSRSIRARQIMYSVRLHVDLELLVSPTGLIRQSVPDT